MNLWELSIFGKRPIYDMILWYLRNSPVDLLKEYLRFGAIGHAKSPVDFVNCDGVYFELDLKTCVEQFIYCFNYYEPGDVAVVKRFFQTGNVMIDVGANIGEYGLLAAKLVGKTGKVYAFEPSPDVLPKLHRNKELNNFDHFNIFPYAVSSSSGTCSFYPGVGDNQGIGSVIDPGDFYVGVRSESPISVDTVTLDDFCVEYKINHVDFIKIDAEGNDLEVLRGSENILKGNQDIVLLVEVLAKEIDSRFQSEKIIPFMKKHGFLPFMSTNKSPFHYNTHGTITHFAVDGYVEIINVLFMRESKARKEGLF